MATAQNNRITLNLLRRVTIAACAAAIVAAAWFGVIIGASLRRYTVTGKFDPTTGYGIEYTVSSRYRKTVDKEPMAQANHELESWAYDPISTSETRPASSYGTGKPASGQGDFGHSIRQATIRGISPPGTMVDARGYIELSGVPQIETIVFKQHLLVSGCPATWYGIDVPLGRDNSTKLTQHFVCLFVRPKDRPIIYGFVGSADTSAEASDVLNEMKAIKDSIRIRKR